VTDFRSVWRPGSTILVRFNRSLLRDPSALIAKLRALGRPIQSRDARVRRLALEALTSLGGS